MTGWLFDTFLATSLLIVLVLLARSPVRRHFGARVAYGLWLLPAARLLMPSLTRTVERTAPGSASVSPFFESGARPVPIPAIDPAAPSLLHQPAGWQTILLIIWAGGALALFLSLMIAFRRERAGILAEAAEIGRIRSIRILRSPRVPSPLAIGIVDRMIVVPADFEHLYDARERRLVLEHELAHHRSGDLLANLVAFALVCLQWVNPLAWIAHAAFRFDQEAACDARVLEKAGPGDRADYGRTLAKAAYGRTLLLASPLSRRNTLQRRLNSMLHSVTLRRHITGRLVIVGVIAIALPLTASRAVDYVDARAPVAPGASSAHGIATMPAAIAVQPAAAPSLLPATPPKPVGPQTFASQAPAIVDWRRIDAAIDTAVDERQLDAAIDAAVDARQFGDDRQIDAVADAAAEQASRGLDRPH